MLFNEPKLLKSLTAAATSSRSRGFSALQRAEIAEMKKCLVNYFHTSGFSALQRAEIAEMRSRGYDLIVVDEVSVLFNEPKLLKSPPPATPPVPRACFSALQRAEIAEIFAENPAILVLEFQCSSTSRNC